MALSAALERFDTIVNRENGMRAPVLPTDIGAVHALYIGSSWRGPKPHDGEPVFHEDGLGPTALCGVHVRVQLAAPFTKTDPDACPRCVAKVNAGPSTADARGGATCGAVLSLVEDDGEISQWVCTRPPVHPRLPHRSNSGATWERRDPETFTPPPDGFV